jgi:plasmid stability protein
MATLTIRDLDDTLKRSLRLRAAGHNRSMEEEARQILRDALRASTEPPVDMVTRLRARFAGLGDVQLELAPREPLPEPRLDLATDAGDVGDAGDAQPKSVPTSPRRSR